ncbi:unnamed protein product [Cylicostephanus goldi]|uniref:Uncharacterized protein n=1 Tax=Cylicostephanus goldi TaxID=71465 RepID=A0A3P7PIM2_CYLGO|nr:unnamed protein product [Cylicostephanus goldi]
MQRAPDGGGRGLGVFEFHDQQVKAESIQVNNPILAAFIREKKQMEDKTFDDLIGDLKGPLPYPQAKPFRFKRTTASPSLKCSATIKEAFARDVLVSAAKKAEGHVSQL